MEKAKQDHAHQLHERLHGTLTGRADKLSDRTCLTTAKEAIRMTSGETRDGIQISDDQKEIHRKICELVDALSDPGAFEVFKSKSLEMDRSTFGKVIIGGWSDSLASAKKGITNLKIISAEIVDLSNE